MLHHATLLVIVDVHLALHQQLVISAQQKTFSISLLSIVYRKTTSPHLHLLLRVSPPDVAAEPAQLVPGGAGLPAVVLAHAHYSRNHTFEPGALLPCCPLIINILCQCLPFFPWIILPHIEAKKTM